MSSEERKIKPLVRTEKRSSLQEKIQCVKSLAEKRGDSAQGLWAVGKARWR